MSAVDRLAAALADRYRIERELGAEPAADAYRTYLAFRQEPEPAMVPQGDSVRAELAGVLGRN
ncbi:MAG TPA: hypothetical protein VFT84_11920 [Gemmatimonadales bacterium]|nr:hypothetical protein [Gemmatimonadales bacterium]